MARIKIKPRCHIDDSVIDLIRELSRLKVERIYQMVEYASLTKRDFMLRQNRTMLARLVPIIQGAAGSGKGLDFEITRLRALEYEKITIGGQHLLAYTREPTIMVEMLPSSIGQARWDIGQYCIAIPKNDLLVGSIENIHFIPSRAPKAADRHPHHYAISNDRGPLFWKPRTCWGSVSEPLAPAMQELDIPDILRTLHVFTIRYYPGSPLRRLNQMPFIQEINGADAPTPYNPF